MLTNQNETLRKKEEAVVSESYSPSLPGMFPEKLPPLMDTHGRTFDYVRIAVTETCNLRCTYCMPEEGIDFAKGENVLTTEEIVRVIRVLASMGVRKVRFTGGEPLMRKDIVSLVEQAASTPGIESVHITTNGIIFPKYAQQLKDAGLTGVNISLDTMDEDKFFEITRRSGIEKVHESIKLASDLGFDRVKVNNVVMSGFNEGELNAFADMTRDNKITVRFIEFMPFDADQIWETGGHFISAETMINHFKKSYPGIAPASGTRTEHHIYQVPGWAGKIAIIPAFTRSLCSNCSRIRITSDGSIRNCLYSDHEYNLMNLMREGGDDEAIVKKFRHAFHEKAFDGFESKKKSAVRESTVKFTGRNSMTMIGG